jgi:hypothetical protein
MFKLIKRVVTDISDYCKIILMGVFALGVLFVNFLLNPLVWIAVGVIYLAFFK